MTRFNVGCAWLTVLATPGCDGVGRAVVGPITKDSGKYAQCDLYAPCQVADSGRKISPLPETWDVDTFGCDGLSLLFTCDLDATPFSGGACVPAHLPAADMPPSIAALCELYALDLRGIQGALTITAPQVDRARLAIFADTPVSLTLDGGSFDHTAIDLHGPVSVNIVNHSKLSFVHITSASPDASLVLRESEAEQLVMANGAGAFEGRVEFVRSAVSVATLMLSELHIESSEVTHSTLRAAQLRAEDFDSDSLTLAVGTAVIASGTLRNFALVECDEMLLSGLSFTDSELHGCTDSALRLYASTVLRGTVDGAIDSKETSFQRTTLAARESTRIDMRGGAIEGSALCQYLNDTTLLRVHTSCNDCQDIAQSEEPRFCKASSEMASVTEDGGTYYVVMNPRCTALDEPAECASPPPDERPF